jgi:hypothetical protein
MELKNRLVTEIDLGKYKNPKSTNFTGRPQGTSVRQSIGLDQLDKDNDKFIEIVIPNGTTSFNPSFYLGLLFDSYKKLGLDEFKKKYKITIASSNPDTRKVLEKNLEDGMRNAINALANKNILKEFIYS